MRNLQTKIFAAKGMHCPNCETVVEGAIKELAGIRKVEADYGAETVEVTFDGARTNLFKIFQAVELRGYECSLIQRTHPVRQRLIKLIEVVLGFTGIALIFYLGLWLEHNHDLPQFDQHLSYGMIFVVGFLTGFHCVGMCGGFIVGYATRSAQKGNRSALSHFAYGFGKTISYTVLGGAFGFFGALITFTPLIRSATAIVAGIFLVVFGLNMLHLFPHLRIFGFRMPAFLNRFVYAESRKHKSPFLIGLLNGLMIACGPLQAMYVMAAGTGSSLEGARMMFLFGAGTLPLLLGFGFLTSLISHKATNVFLQASGVLVLALGLIMVNRGLILSGSGYDFKSLIASTSARIEFLAKTQGTSGKTEAGFQVIHMEVNKKGYQPNSFVLKKGVPVKWIIDGKELNECNRAITVPKLGLQFDIKAGEQVIEFTPRERGTILWSCWMGMIRGSFQVQDEPTGTIEETDTHRPR
ncbi:MAG TPA: sulfite exporter TauE/SafE family protein [Methylococcaceae bacterium]|jgi:sulfite exporter TauE/SafE/copper chaperone CopZ|nr:sulfite exporter TauE/SafE family protein [Methylococcaceae bacterium]